MQLAVGCLAIAPAETVGYRPIDEERLADDIGGGKSPQARESRLFIVLSPITMYDPGRR